MKKSWGFNCADTVAILNFWPYADVLHPTTLIQTIFKQVPIHFSNAFTTTSTDLVQVSS